jgi:hypothetical protein
MSKQNGRRRWVLAEADTHAGHKVGLCNPVAVLLDDQKNEAGVNLGAYQRHIWDLRMAFLQEVATLAGRAEVIHVHDGDVTHGNKHASGLITTRIEDQMEIADWNMRPVYDLPGVRRGRFISGTEAHTFGEASSEIALAKRLSLRYPKYDIQPLAHSVLEVDGVVLDVSHHGPGAGIRQWTRGNVARHYLRSRMWQDFKRGRKPADVYLRGHYHTFVWETLREQFGGEMVTSHLVVLPSWCGMTEYARQATKSEYEVTNGLVLLELAAGRVEVHPMVRSLDLRVEEKL